MAAVKSRGNKSTELTFLKLLRSQHIKGWRRHYKKLDGTPDFVFPKEKITVFIDGCFWHGCKVHMNLPKSNKLFWKNKILRNIRRDLLVKQNLKTAGWKVVRVWEHQLSKKAISNIKLDSLLSLK